MLAQVFIEPSIDWAALSPQIALLSGSLVILLVRSLSPVELHRTLYTAATFVTGAVTMVCAFVLWFSVHDDGARSVIAGALGVDGFSLFFTILIAATVMIATLLIDGYAERERLMAPELDALVLAAALGGIVMASANDLIVLFLGLETLSIGLYVMTAMHARRRESQEAAMKYFVLGAFSSAFFLYGIALMYGATGSTNLVAISQFLRDVALTENGLLLAGFALLLVGLGFKVAAVPFHMWVPDIYQGSPTPITGFMASAAKAAGFAAFLRVFFVTLGTYRLDWAPLVWAMAVLTLVVGSVLAIVQDDVKRLLAYSSVAHAGYILVGVEAATDEGTAASLFYLFTYSFMVLGSFAVVTLVGRVGDDAHSIDDYRGLYRRRPVLAFAFTFFLLAQAGVPFTSGFIAKFVVIRAAVDSDSVPLAVIAMVSAVIGAFLYLRVITAMYSFDTDDAEEAPAVPVPLLAGIAVAATFAFTAIVGIVPQFMLEFSRDAIPILVASG